MEYLLAQSNRGDQLIAHHNDMPEVPPEEPEEDSEIDTTVCHAADLRADDSDPPVAVVQAQVTSQVGDTEPKSPDEEVTEEEEDDTASPSTSSQVILLSCTIFYFLKKCIWYSAKHLLSTMCKVKIYACTMQNNYYNTVYIYWTVFGFFSISRVHSVIPEVSWAGRQLMPWQPTWLA